MGEGRPNRSPLVNARSETVGEKPAFRQAIKYRRCLIPASGFYEWRREGDKKPPLYIRLKDGSPMLFAGVWETGKSPDGKSVDSCAILTTSANDLVAPLHDRMQVILHPGEYDNWLDRDQRDPEKLKAWYAPFPTELMETFPASPGDYLGSVDVQRVEHKPILAIAGYNQALIDGMRDRIVNGSTKLDTSNLAGLYFFGTEADLNLKKGKNKEVYV